MEEHTLQVSVGKIFWEIFGYTTKYPNTDRMLYNKELCDLQSPTIVREVRTYEAVGNQICGQKQGHREQKIYLEY